MSYFDNPGVMDVAIEELFYRFCGSFYSTYLRTLGLKGDERVLEFGSGSGACSRQLLRVLAGGGTLTCLDTSHYWMERAKKRLKGHHTVMYLCGDIRHLEIENGSFDAIIVHLVLHDIEAAERQGNVDALAAALRLRGSLYIRGPTSDAHGMPAEDIRALIRHAGLREVVSIPGKSLLTGPLYAGVYVKE